jgi:hypothetical protein
MAALCRPGRLESDDQLQAAWGDNNRQLSLQLQNMMLRRFQKEARQVMHDQVGYIDDLQERVRELERLVIQSQTREQVAIRKNSELALQGPSGSSTLKPVQPVQPASPGSTTQEKKPLIDESIVDPPADSTHVTLPDLPEKEPTTVQPSMLVNPREPRRTSKAVNLQPLLSIRYQRASATSCKLVIVMLEPLTSPL